MKLPHFLILTGPESSGKTTTAQLLAKSLQVPLVPEYARIYLENTNGIYRQPDLVKIAKRQYNLMKKAQSDYPDTPYVIVDTAFLVIKIWSLEKYGSYDFRLQQWLRQCQSATWFLCDWNIPWEPDPLRENPADRNRLYQRYLYELKKNELRYHQVFGLPEQRVHQINQIINAKTDI